MSILDHINQALTRFEKLDLAESYEDRYGPCSPCKPEKKKWYPTVYLNGTKADISKIPGKGKATIEYKVTSRTTRENGDGEKKHDLTLEIHSIDPDAPSKAKTPKDGAKMIDGAGVGKSITEELSEAMENLMQLTRFGTETVQRQRSESGTFVANETGGADPTTMRQAYGDPSVKKKRLAAAGAGAAVGAVAGAVGARALMRRPVASAAPKLPRWRVAQARGEA